MNDAVISPLAGSILARACSTVMKNLAAIVERIAPSNLSVLIVGENGTGKEWIARAIHQLSPRSGNRFLPIDCVAFHPDKFMEVLFGFKDGARTRIDRTRGAIEQAQGGTIFLDNVGVLPSPIQKQLGRTFASQDFRGVGDESNTHRNVRLIAALSTELNKPGVESSRRMDVNQSISPLIVNLPPLREHREDIPYFIETFFLQSNHKRCDLSSMFSPEALRVCLSYDWPGNIRQLRTVVEHAATRCQDRVIQVEHLPLYIHDGRPYELLENHPGLKTSTSQTGEGVTADPSSRQIEGEKEGNQ
jgi:two-component system response regulator HydG